MMFIWSKRDYGTVDTITKNIYTLLRKSVLYQFPLIILLPIQFSLQVTNINDVTVIRYFHKRNNGLLFQRAADLIVFSRWCNKLHRIHSNVLRSFYVLFIFKTLHLLYNQYVHYSATMIYVKALCFNSFHLHLGLYQSSVISFICDCNTYFLGRYKDFHFHKLMSNIFSCSLQAITTSNNHSASYFTAFACYLVF